MFHIVPDDEPTSERLFRALALTKCTCEDCTTDDPHDHPQCCPYRQEFVEVVTEDDVVKEFRELCTCPPSQTDDHLDGCPVPGLLRALVVALLVS
jgi:hypothetical protein